MFEDIISLKNLCMAWEEFVRGKKSKKDVAEFSLNLADNLFFLHEDLKNKTYEHGGYKAFKINDPKPRIYTRHLFVIEYYIMLFIEFFILISIVNSLLPHTLVGIIRELTKL